jgi:siroheme synthase-like protein
MFPIMLVVRDRSCLVVGGGGVALRKAQGLVEEGARVTVVAPQVVAPLEAMADRGQVRLELRCYSPPEATGFALVFAATDDRAVNRRVFEDAQAANVWVNVADDPELCSFHLAGRVRRGPLQIAIGSAGEAPFVVRRLRQLLERRLGSEWSEWMEAAGRFRRAVRRRQLDRPQREECYERFFQATVDGDSLRARVPTADEEATWLEAPVEDHTTPARRHGRRWWRVRRRSGPVAASCRWWGRAQAAPAC